MVTWPLSIKIKRISRQLKINTKKKKEHQNKHSGKFELLKTRRLGEISHKFTRVHVFIADLQALPISHAILVIFDKRDLISSILKLASSIFQRVENIFVI